MAYKNCNFRHQETMGQKQKLIIIMTHTHTHIQKMAVRFFYY